jgi:amino acid adenylation domain-containing protein
MDKNIVITTEMFEQARQYWLHQLAGPLPELDIPGDLGSSSGYRREILEFPLNRELGEKLTFMSNGSDMLLFILMLTGFYVTLHKYTEERDIVIVTPTLQKSRQHYNRLVALRGSIPEGGRFKEMLQAVKGLVMAGYKNQHYPLHKVLDALGGGVESSIHKCVLLLEGFHKNDALEDIPQDVTNDLIVRVKKDGKAINLEVAYNGETFSPNAIRTLCSCYDAILAAALPQPDVEIDAISVVDDQGRETLIKAFNETTFEYDTQQTVGSMFLSQASQYPDNLAVKDHKEELTYRQLEERSRKLATILKQEGLVKGDIVALETARGCGLLVGMLGIVFAGGAYMPVDPKLPAGRRNTMIESSGASIVLSDNSPLKWDAQSLAPVEPLDTIASLSPRSLLYVIFTSGSTGTPKGVMVNHGSLVNMASYHRHLFADCAEDRMSQVASIGFDAAGFEIWSALLSGSSLIVAGDLERTDPAEMKRWLMEHKITKTFQPTMMAEKLLDMTWDDGHQHLKIMRTAGDRLTKYPPLDCPFRLFNLYGPTEDTVWTTYQEVSPGNSQLRGPSIGRPVGNHRVYILGSDLLPRPVGVPGEMCISGSGVARGYLGDEELTAQKFVEDPFHPGQTMYRSGDRARWLENGTLEFLGRLDNQVKIRGMRIELEEIEQRIISFDGIGKAVVIPVTTGDATGQWKETDNRVLCAYYIAPDEVMLKDLKDYLANYLPDFMVPPYFMRVEEFPLTPNGKIDLKALPSPRPAKDTPLTPPRNRVERALVEIWAWILQMKVESIGIDHNFFDLGGHSLKATQMVAQIHKQLNVRVDLADVFRITTIRLLAEHIATLGEDVLEAITPAGARAMYPLSGAQMRIFGQHHMQTDSTSYNVQTILDIRGSLDDAKLERAFVQLIKRHHSLRTSFEIVGDDTVQRIHDDVPFAIQRFKVELSGETEEQPPALKTIIRDFIRPFDLAQAPLLRVGVVEAGEDRKVLMVDMHHIISDGRSFEILKEDFIRLYNEEELAPLPLQYIDYAHWLHQEHVARAIEKQEEFWLQEFSDGELLMNLPLDYPRPDSQNFSGGSVRFTLDEAAGKKLKALGRQHDMSDFMVHLALYTVLLSKLCRQEEVVVGTAIAGRRHPDLESIIGVFVNVLALRNTVEPNVSFSDFLLRVKDRAIAAFKNQDYQFQQLVERVVTERHPGRHPLYSAGFAFASVEEGNDRPRPDIQGLAIAPFRGGETVAKLDLNLSGMAVKDNVHFAFDYATSLFRHETVKGFAASFSHIAAVVAENPGISIQRIDLVSAAEKKRLEEEIARQQEQVEIDLDI